MNVDLRNGWKRPLPVVLLALLAPGIRAAEPDAKSDGRVQELQLQSGGKLIGEVKSHKSDGEWEVASPDAVEPIRLKPGSVRSLARIASGQTRENPPAATLVFLSGDRIPVDITGFDGSTFQVRSPWAEEARPVEWKRLRQIIFEETGVQRVFSGPLPGQKWAFTSGLDRARMRGDGVGVEEAGEEASKQDSWKTENNTLVASGPGSASVDANLPDKLSISYDLEWTGMLSMSMAMFTDSFLPSDPDEPDGPTIVANAAKEGEVMPLREGIAIDINQHSFILRSHSPDQGQDMMGSGQMPQDFRNRTKVRIMVRIDRKEGICGLWVGDRLIRKWVDLGNLGGTGKALSFWQHHGNGSVVIQRLVVRTWNGKFEEDAPPSENEKDILVAADGTKLTGKLGPMADGKFTMETSVGPIEAGLADLRYLVRAGAGGKEKKSGKSKPEGAVVTLAGGSGKFVLEDFRVESDGAVFIGRHAELGELSLPDAEVEFVNFGKDEEIRPDSTSVGHQPPAARPPVRKIILPGIRNGPGGDAAPPGNRRPIPFNPLPR